MWLADGAENGAPKISSGGYDATYRPKIPTATTTMSIARPTQAATEMLALGELLRLTCASLSPRSFRSEPGCQENRGDVGKQVRNDVHRHEDERHGLDSGRVA